jgi:hypothetical protein
MKEKLDLLGALVAHVIYISSILVFIARLVDKAKPGQWFGIPLLLSAFPLIYLLWTASQLKRSPLYYLQVSLMLLWIAVLFLLDYVYKVDFRQTRWMVISFVVLFFAGTGGMLGVTSLAGRGWTISACVLFLIMAVLAFVQRAITGM